MSYFVNLGSWGRIFPVPFDVVDRHLKISNPVHLKILLYMLRHSGEELSREMIAKACGALPEDVDDAISYWTEAEIICRNGAEIVPANIDEREIKWHQPAKEAAIPVKNTLQQEAQEKNDSKPIQIPTRAIPTKQTPKPTHEECAAALAGLPELQALIDYSQSTLGKLLSRAEIDTLVSLNLWAGMPVEVILLAIGHCAAIGKVNMRYIEKVVLNWLDNEIDTVSKADAYLQDLSDRNKAWETVLSVVGIDRRKPSQREDDYCKKWIVEWNFDREMLKLAYNICVNSTGKLSFSYMNKILQRWHDEQRTNPEEVQAADQKKKAQPSNHASKKRKTSYDIDELERRLGFDFENDTKQEEE